MHNACRCITPAHFEMHVQAAQRQHSGCTLGKVISTGSYQPALWIRWQGGKVTKRHCIRASDPLVALQRCSPRFSTAKPFPAVLPVAPEFLEAALGSSAAVAKRRRAGPHTPAACSSDLPQDAQQAMTQLVTKAMQQHSFKEADEAAVAPPEVTRIKAMGAGILLAGRFFCQVSGSYHASSQSYFMLMQNGTLFQKCHRDGCDGRFDCGKVQVPAVLAAVLQPKI